MPERLEYLPISNSLIYKSIWVSGLGDWVWCWVCAPECVCVCVCVVCGEIGYGRPLLQVRISYFFIKISKREDKAVPGIEPGSRTAEP